MIRNNFFFYPKKRKPHKANACSVHFLSTIIPIHLMPVFKFMHLTQIIRRLFKAKLYDLAGVTLPLKTGQADFRNCLIFC